MSADREFFGECSFCKTVNGEPKADALVCSGCGATAAKSEYWADLEIWIWSIAQIKPQGDLFV